MFVFNIVCGMYVLLDSVIYLRQLLVLDESLSVLLDVS